jgi:hypothetical protein
MVIFFVAMLNCSNASIVSLTVLKIVYKPIFLNVQNYRIMCFNKKKFADLNIFLKF